MKRFVAGMICGAALMLTTSVFADGAYEQITAYLDHSIKVEVDGKKVELANTPVNYDGSTYLPVRELAGAVGLSVDWDEASRTAKLSSDSKTDPNQSNQTGTGKAVVDIDKPTVIIELMGQKFIQFNGIMKFHDHARFEFNSVSQILTLYWRENNQNTKTLIQDVPYIIESDTLLINYDYYNTNIKPLF